MVKPFDDTTWWGAAATSPFAHESDFDGITVKDAQDWLLPRFRAGEIHPCPCCGQHVKLYPRTITKAMAGILAAFATWGGPVSRKEAVRIAKGCGDYAKMVYWGLIAKTEHGWIVTETGRRFLAGEIHVPKWMLLYDERAFGCSRAQISIHDAMGQRFILGDLMDPGTVDAATAAPA